MNIILILNNSPKLSAPTAKSSSPAKSPPTPLETSSRVTLVLWSKLAATTSRPSSPLLDPALERSLRLTWVSPHPDTGLDWIGLDRAGLGVWWTMLMRNVLDRSSLLIWPTSPRWTLLMRSSSLTSLLVAVLLLLSYLRVFPLRLSALLLSKTPGNRIEWSKSKFT